MIKTNKLKKSPIKIIDIVKRMEPCFELVSLLDTIRANL